MTTTTALDPTVLEPTPKPASDLCRVLQVYALLATTATHGSVNEAATVSYAARLLTGRAVERRRTIRIP